MILVLPLVLGIAGAIGLAALGAYGGVRLGKFLNGTLSTEEKEYLAQVFERFAIVDVSDTHKIDQLSVQQKEQLFLEIDHKVKQMLTPEELTTYEEIKKKVLRADS